MLTSYPIKINNTAIPFPENWEENPKKISNEFATEAGGRKKIEIRNKRLSVSAFSVRRGKDGLTVLPLPEDANP